MSYLLTRIRRAFAEPPEEPTTTPMLMAITAHWKSLFESDPVKFAPLRSHLEGMGACAEQTEDKQQACITAAFARWEAARAAFQPEATLGGLPGQPGTFGSADWGTHWILFHWSPPETGGPAWGYRVERSADNREFCLMDMCVDPEVALLRQPPGHKFYYRVVPFNGFGDGPASNVFSIAFDAEVVDWEKRQSEREEGGQ